MKITCPLFNMPLYQPKLKVYKRQFNRMLQKIIVMREDKVLLSEVQRKKS